MKSTFFFSLRAMKNLNILYISHQTVVLLGGTWAPRPETVRTAVLFWPEAPKMLPPG